MMPQELRNLGLNIIPMDLQAKRTPIVRGVKRLNWGAFASYRPTDRCIEAWQRMFPNAGWGIVTGGVSGVFVLDADLYKDPNCLAGKELPKTWMTKTQSGGLHYYFKWDSRLGFLVTTKRKLWDNVDIRGNGGYVVAYPWVEGHSPKDVPLAPVPEWLMKLLDKPQEVVANKQGWITEAMAKIQENGRHHTFAKLIGRFNRDGLSAEDIYTLLLPHWENVGLERGELLMQVRNMTKRYADQANKPLVGLTAKQLLSGANTKVPWLVDGLFPKEGVGIIAGHAKIGKSWLTLDLATAVSHGLPWFNKFKTVPGRVLYVDEESSMDMLRARFLKLLNYKGLDDAAILFLQKTGFEFSTQSKIDELRQVLDQWRPSLIIFDSLNRVHKAEENSASQMAEIFRRVNAVSKEYGCFILFLDHLPHGMDRFRGTTDKEAFVDTGFLATKVGGQNILLDHKYARVTTPVSPFELAILDDGPDKTYVRWIG